MQALGFIETRSLTASIEASDVMTKTADVWVVGTEKIGSGLVNVVIQGDVDAVTAAVKAGEAVAKEIGTRLCAPAGDNRQFCLAQSMIKSRLCRA